MHIYGKAKRDESWIGGLLVGWLGWVLLGGSFFCLFLGKWSLALSVESCFYYYTKTLQPQRFRTLFKNKLN